MPAIPAPPPVAKKVEPKPAETAGEAGSVEDKKPEGPKDDMPETAVAKASDESKGPDADAGKPAEVEAPKVEVGAGASKGSQAEV